MSFRSHKSIDTAKNWVRGVTSCLGPIRATVLPGTRTRPAGCTKQKFGIILEPAGLPAYICFVV
jgi:hypothetical protein